MAKSLKVIVCPKCGSNKKTETKPDFFVCESCKTEYFLDREEITIIHKNHPNTTPPVASIENLPKIIGIVFGVIFLSSFLLIFIPSIFFNNKTTNKISEKTSSIEELNDEKAVVFKSKEGKVYFMILGIEYKGSYENKKKRILGYIYDENGKEIKKLEPNISVPASLESAPFEDITMSNGEVYYIFNKKMILKVLPEQLDIQDITPQIISKIPEYASGIASVVKQYDQDGFKIMNFNGKSTVYMPIINKVYSADNFYLEERKMPPAPTPTTYIYKTTTVGTDDKSYLLKLVYNNQIGYPRDRTYFDFDETKGITPRFKSNNLVSWTPLLKHRVFFGTFGPKILYQDDKYFVLSTQVDPVNKSQIIQKIDIQTEQIVWTFECAEFDKHVNMDIYSGIANDKHLLLIGNMNHLILDYNTGKLLHTINL